ncbi:MAG: VanZ family protein [Clostridia bacterium]|nr:VanZ family protein [Clostridia bacterium]
MKTSKKLFTLLAAVCCLITAVSTAIVLAVILIPSVTIRHMLFFVLIGISIVFAIFTVIFACEAITNDKVRRVAVRTTVIIFFCTYVLIFIGILLLVKAYSNYQNFNFAYNKNWLEESLPNLIPFRPTVSKISSLVSGETRFTRFVFEALGNTLAYVPLALFLPALFKSKRNFESFLPTIVFITVSVELFQGMFGVGSCRLDDVIFGAGAACIVYAILKRPKIQKFFEEKYIYF